MKKASGPHELWRRQGDGALLLIQRYETFLQAVAGADAFGPGTYRVCDASGNRAAIRVARRRRRHA